MTSIELLKDLMSFIISIKFVLFFGASFFILFLFLILVVTKRIKTREHLSRAMNLTLFLITIPRSVHKDEKFSLEEYLKTAEQFYSSLSGLKETSVFKKSFVGNPFLVFEIAVHRIGEEIYFYLACPRNLAGLIEKQILAFWPKAQIQPSTDYNIFNPEGKSAGIIASLENNYLFPLKMVSEFSFDPLSAITSVFTKLAKEGEGAAIQFLIRPTKKNLKGLAEKKIDFLRRNIKDNSLVRGALKDVGGVFVPGGISKKEKGGNGKSFLPESTPLVQHQISVISQKASKTVFDVNLRILASAATEFRVSEILNQLQSAFEQFNSPISNSFKFRKPKGRRLKKLFYDFSFRKFNEGEIMILSSAELAAIFHLPSPSVLTPHIKWMKSKQAPPPANLPQEGIVIGKNIFRGEERLVSILPDDRRRHFYIIGQTGTGKSVLLQEMVKQDIRMGQGVALIDPHGDIAEKMLTLVPRERIKDVIYFNPSDFERPIGLNMLEFDPKHPESKTFVVNELLEIFEKLYNLKIHGFGGPVFEQYMRNSLLLVMEDQESGSTLIEVPKVLSDANFRKYKLSKCKNIVVKNFWELEAEKAGGEAALANMVPYITSKMNIFIANDFVRPIVSQQHSSFNFRKIMDQGKILIINLSKGKLGDINSYLLGMIIMGKILMAAFSRADIPEEKRRDFNLYIDEFHNVTTKTITTVLAEARKYRLSLTFAHQFIGQLDEDIRKAVFGNVGSFLTFRVGPDDAKYLVTEYSPVFDEEDLVNFDNYNGALKLLIKGETSPPFNIVTFPPSSGDPLVAQQIKEYSRTVYGKDRNAIEKELYDRLSKRYF